MAAKPEASDQGEASHPCIDRQSAGDSCVAEAVPPRAAAVGSADRAVDFAPETLYLVRIAMLEATVAELEATVAELERDRQHVIDRYERVLQERDACRDEPLVSDEFDAHEPDADEDAGESDPDRSSGALGRVRALLR